MKKGFTLVELLVTVAIIAILATVVVLTLNPIEMLRQARDTARISDVNTIDNAVSLYYSNALNDPSTLFMGTSSVIYVSVPDSVATSTAGDQCQGLDLSALPQGWSYHCAASSTYLDVNGTGWIPINFASYVAGSAISELPIDPDNQTSTSEYYTYATDGMGGYQIYAHLESQKYTPKEALTGGYDLASYKKGTNVNIAPLAGGLMAYWPFNDGSGSTAADYSGADTTGTLSGGATWTTGQTGSALLLNGSPAAVAIATNTDSIVDTGALTLCAWVLPTSPGQDNVYYTFAFAYPFEAYLASVWWTANQTTSMAVGVTNDGYGHVAMSDTNTPAITFGIWHQVCIARSSIGDVTIYIDGAPNGNVNQFAGTPTTPYWNLRIGETGTSSISYVGAIDNYMIYDRELSASEVQQIYNSQKM